MVEFNPDDRPTAAELLEDEIFHQNERTNGEDEGEVEEEEDAGTFETVGMFPVKLQ